MDKFFNRVPYEKVPEIYAQSDILIKTSLLESFSYPPLEMMATGGYVLAVPNGGNIEYLKDNENCLLYKAGNISKAEPEPEEANNLLVFCRTPRTRKEICEYLGLSSVTYAIQTHVMPLVASGKIKMTNPEKPKSPKQLFYSE